MPSSGTIGPRLRGAAVALVALAAGGALATQGLAAPAARCFDERATITGSGIITGTDGDDVIVGSAADDDIDGLGGEDLICALAGNDRPSGGVGDDKVDGGEGDDRMRGDVTNRIEGGSAVGGGNDWVYGGPGDDIVDGDSTNFVGLRPAAGTTTCSAARARTT